MTVPAPSGKDKDYENFPVGSIFIARKLRGIIHHYYRFARTADDISDHPHLTPFEKKKRLSLIKQALLSSPSDPSLAWLSSLRDDFQHHGIPLRHATDLLHAFTLDADNLRYPNYDSLISDYCRYSAAPVGRFLLALHGEDERGVLASDSLCHLLQLLNHLQDIRDDATQLHRIYLPQDWLQKAGATIEDCTKDALTPALQQVVGWMLDGCDQLLIEAQSLPSLLQSRRLRMESALIVSIAAKLITRLRHHDPLQKRVQLSKGMYLACFLKTIAKGL